MLPLVKRNQPSKFTSENISRIKDWVAQGVGRDEIANRLEVSVGSLQVTCSRLGISLRRRSLPGGSGAWLHSARGHYMQPTNLNLKAIARDATLRGDTKTLFHA